MEFFVQYFLIIIYFSKILIHPPTLINNVSKTKINQFNDIIDKTSYIYLLSSLRYAHSECDNIMYINITDSYVINHYECAINSTRVKEIFLKYGFKILNEYNVDIFPFLDKSQISYTPNIEVIEFSNNNEF